MLWPWKNCPDRKSFQERTTLSELTNDSPTAGYMTYNTPVEVTRKLRKVGGSVMVPLPPEILQEAGLVGAGRRGGRGDGGVGLAPGDVSLQRGSP